MRRVRTVISSAPGVIALVVGAVPSWSCSSSEARADAAIVRDSAAEVLRRFDRNVLAGLGGVLGPGEAADSLLQAMREPHVDRADSLGVWLRRLVAARSDPLASMEFVIPEVAPEHATDSLIDRARAHITESMASVTDAGSRVQGDLVGLRSSAVGERFGLASEPAPVVEVTLEALRSDPELERLLGDLSESLRRLAIELVLASRGSGLLAEELEASSQ